MMRSYKRLLTTALLLVLLCGSATANLPAAGAAANAAPASAPSQQTVPGATCEAPRWCVAPAPNETRLESVTVAGPNEVWAINSTSSGSTNAYALQWNGTSWQTYAVPSPGQFPRLYSIAAASDTDNRLWAVGHRTRNSGENCNECPLITRRNGTSWQARTNIGLAYPKDQDAIYAYHRLYSVAPVSSDEAWAFGRYEYSTPPNQYELQEPFIEHCTASGCEGLPVTRTLNAEPMWSAGGNATLLGGTVVGNPNGTQTVWAVGYTTGSRYDPVMQKPLLLRYQGGRWSSVPLTDTLLVGHLNSIDAYAWNDIWAVGAYRSQTAGGVLILHYDGVRWRHIINVPQPPSGVGNLMGVYVTKERDVWAVGQVELPSSADDPNGWDSMPRNFAGPNEYRRPLIMHWYGSSLSAVDEEKWQIVPSDSPTPGSTLLAVAALPYQINGPITSVWAVGSHNTQINPYTRVALVEKIAAPTPPPSTVSYYAVPTGTINLDLHYQRGQEAAQNNELGFVTLFYGNPYNMGTRTSPKYGVQFERNGTLYSANSVADIEVALRRYVDGYFSIVGNGSGPRLTVAVAITNRNLDKSELSGGTYPADFPERYAEVWNGVIRRVQIYANNVAGRTPSALTLAAAYDAEPDFVQDDSSGGFDVTYRWAVSYNNANSDSTIKPPYYMIGSTDGYPCPPGNPIPLPGEQECRGDDWNSDGFYQLAWGIPSAYPVPQIYLPEWSRYWYVIKRYGLTQYPNSLTMRFRGSLPGCFRRQICYPDTGNSHPGYQTGQDWQSLWLMLNADSQTQQSLDWSTTLCDLNDQSCVTQVRTPLKGSATMKPTCYQLNRCKLTAVVLAVIATLLLACSTQVEQPNTESVVFIAQTPVASVLPATATVYDVKAAMELTSMSGQATELSLHLQTSTVLALTPTQFWPTPEPTWTPAPPPTEIVGVIRQTCTIDSFIVCGGWRGLLNGEMYHVYVGAYRSRGMRQYRNVGVLAVKRAGERVNESRAGFYDIPDNFGVATVLEINGVRLTLAQVNPNPMTDALGVVNLLSNGRRIIFDLATRQFLTPDGTPYPAGTLTPPPAGTLTPAPVPTAAP